MDSAEPSHERDHLLHNVGVEDAGGGVDLHRQASRAGGLDTFQGALEGPREAAEAIVQGSRGASRLKATRLTPTRAPRPCERGWSAPSQ